MRRTRRVEKSRKDFFNILLVFSSMLKAFSDRSIEMIGGFHPPEDYGGTYSIKTVPVKTEYPVGRVFDIALIDAESLRAYGWDTANIENWANDAFWNQPVRAAIEIKYLQLGDRLAHCLRGVDADIQKLKSYQLDRTGSFLGISMLFIQSTRNGRLEETLTSNNKAERTDNPESGVHKYIISKKRFQRIPVLTHSLYPEI